MHHEHMMRLGYFPKIAPGLTFAHGGAIRQNEQDLLPGCFGRSVAGDHAQDAERAGDTGKLPSIHSDLPAVSSGTSADTVSCGLPMLPNCEQRT